MPSGIQVTGSHGLIQIDESHYNLALLAKASFSAGSSIVVSNATRPVVALGAGNPAVPWVVSMNGSDATIAFKGGPGTAYIFDDPVPQGSGAGIQVFDASGKCCYDSSHKYMRVVGANSFSANILHPSDPGISHSSGSQTWAVMFSSFGGRIRSNGVNSGMGFWYADVFAAAGWVSGNTVRVTALDAGNAQAPSEFYDSINDGTAKGGSYLLLDVTGY